MAYEDDYTEEQPLTPGMRLLRGRGGAAVVDEDQSGPGGEPNTGATPNTQEPHEQRQESAAAGDSATQAPSKPSPGQRLLGASSPTAGITAHNNDGSPAQVAPTGTSYKDHPSIGIQPAAPAAPAGSPATATSPAGAPASTIGQRLLNLRQPPAAPKMNPEQSAVQQDLREHSQVTPKTDLNTGKTLDQYKMGFGQRLLGSLVNFGNGMARNGAEPIQVGPGATNRRYTVDETNRQQRVAGDQAKIKSMDDEYNQAEKGYGHELTSYNDEARAAGKADSEERLRNYENKLTTERTAHNKAEENLRGENNDLKAQPKTYEQYVGALEAEKDPGKKAVLQRVVDRLEKQKNSGKGPKLSAKDQLKLDAYMNDNKIDDVGDMTNADIKKALAASDGPAHTKDRQSFEEHWTKGFAAVEKKYDAQRKAVLKSYGAENDASMFEKNKDEINSKFADIEAKREADKSSLQSEKDKEAEQYQVYGKPARQQSSAAPAPAGNQGIEQPIASVRTGAPATQPTQGAKSISKADVQKLAQKHGLSYEDAAKQFTGKGYSIQ